MSQRWPSRCPLSGRTRCVTGPLSKGVDAVSEASKEGGGVKELEPELKFTLDFNLPASREEEGDADTSWEVRAGGEMQWWQARPICHRSVMDDPGKESKLGW